MKGFVKYLLIALILVFVIATVVVGALLISFSLTIPGRFDMEQGICIPDVERQVHTISGRSNTYRPIWQVSVYLPADTNFQGPLYRLVTGLEGDLSSISFKFYSSESATETELAKYPANVSTACIYPSNPIAYPNSNSNKPAVHLGNYTQSQISDAHSKSQSLDHAGIALIVIGGVAAIAGLIVFIVMQCTKKKFSIYE